jgi:nitrite reductase/ring-hydroxylating ferredoxin subunit
MVAAGGLRPLCASARLEERGDGLRFDVEVDGQRATAFALRHRGQVVAYLNRCSHVAMELDWIEGRFLDVEGNAIVCATHGAAYDPAGGHCLGGPCSGRGGLRPIDVCERDGVVYWRPDLLVRPRREEAPPA